MPPLATAAPAILPLNGPVWYHDGVFERPSPPPGRSLRHLTSGAHHTLTETPHGAPRGAA